MSGKLKFSVITVCYNAEKELAATLESIQKQDYPSVEVVVVDGGSTDKTLQIVASFVSVLDLNWISEKDNGIYDAMNKGISRAKGDVIQFLNAGDFFLHHSVLTHVAERFQTTNMDILHGVTVAVDESGGIKFLKLEKANRITLFGQLINHQSVFAKNYVFKSDQPAFNTRLRIFADYDWMLRIFFKKGVTVAHMNVGIAVYKRGGFSDVNFEKIGAMELRGVRDENYNYWQQKTIRIVRQRKFNWFINGLLKIPILRRNFNHFLGENGVE